MTDEVKSIKKRIAPILKKAGVSRSAIFGSYARGDNKPESDIDILVDLPDNWSLFDIAELKYILEDKLEKKVDLVQYKKIKNRIKDNILSEQIPVL